MCRLSFAFVVCIWQKQVFSWRGLYCKWTLLQRDSYTQTLQENNHLGVQDMIMLYPNHLSLGMTKQTKWPVHPVKTQISLGIHPVWSESSLFAWRSIRSLATHLRAQRRLWSVWVDAQADLSLRCAHRSFYRFCHMVAHLIMSSVL